MEGSRRRASSFRLRRSWSAACAAAFATTDSYSLPGRKPIEIDTIEIDSWRGGEVWQTWESTEELKRTRGTPFRRSGVESGGEPGGCGRAKVPEASGRLHAGDGADLTDCRRGRRRGTRVGRAGFGRARRPQSSTPAPPRESLRLGTPPLGFQSCSDHVKGFSGLVPAFGDNGKIVKIGEQHLVLADGN